MTLFLQLAGAGALSWLFAWLWIRWVLALGDRWTYGKTGERDGEGEEKAAEKKPDLGFLGDAD